ncbi:MAG TPA: capsule assembly Wzi family protein [Acidobacteriaceae bacterium]|nr:capsule assembly Wzi family protein [Acidobacteriaceae bacterium]
MRLDFRRTARQLALSFGPLLCIAWPATAQSTWNAGGRSEVFVNSDLERYLRYLQTEGRVGLYPWSIRDFSPRELDSLLPITNAHPWSARYDIRRKHRGSLTLDYVRPTATTRFNSAYPYGSNDGPIWAGRGFTTSIQAGVAVRWRWFSLKLAPIAFHAQNRVFPLMSNGETGSFRFADGSNPNGVDRPQRFGDSPYDVFDPGESSFRVDTRLIAAGISTADQGWGPADTYPYILGNNAAGFPHVFLGTGMPLNVWVARVHARLVYGRLDQTAFSSMPKDSARRFMSGAIAVVEPRGIPGLELGASRFFHSMWPEGGPDWSDLRIPLEPVGKKSLIDATGMTDDLRNQLASIFFRWVLPHSGFEVYGEFGKEDHNWDLRDLILDPDHAATHMFGFRKVWASDSSRMLALRGEMIDMRFNTLTRTRDIGGGYYIHAQIRQGHTEDGQLLGANVTAGSGAGATLALEGYRRKGRWSIAWTRTLVDTAGDYSRTGVRPLKSPEVQHALGFDALFFCGPVDLHTGLSAMYEFNRYFASDRFNLNAIIGTRWSW